MKHKHTDVTDTVMERIESGEVTMRPRWQLATLGLLAAVALTALTIVAIYVTSFLVYKVRLELADGQARGLEANVTYLAGKLPWIALAAFVVSLVGLVWFVKRFDFSYRAGRWVIWGILLLCIVTGTILAFTDLNHRLESGPLRGLYGQHKENQDNQNRGRDKEPLHRQQ